MYCAMWAFILSMAPAVSPSEYLTNNHHWKQIQNRSLHSVLDCHGHGLPLPLLWVLRGLQNEPSHVLSRHQTGTVLNKAGAISGQNILNSKSYSCELQIKLGYIIKARNLNIVVLNKWKSVPLSVMGSQVKVGTRTDVKSTSAWDFSIWSISPSLFSVLTSPGSGLQRFYYDPLWGHISMSKAKWIEIGELERFAEKTCEVWLGSSDAYLGP